MNPLDLFTGNLWKAGTIAAGAVAVGLGIALTVVTFEKAGVERDLTAARASIDDPKTGYVVRLAQAETNVAQLKASVTASNKATEDLAAADAARLAAVSKQLDAVQVVNRRSADRLAVFLSAPPKGADACAQSKDVDDRVLEMFK